MTPPARWVNTLRSFLLRAHPVTGYTLSVDAWDDLDLTTVEEPDLTQADTFVLHAELRRLDGQLAAMGEILKAVSPEARELHSRRGAIVVILKNRRAL